MVTADHVQLPDAVYVDACPEVVVGVQVVDEQATDALVGENEARRHTVTAEILGENVPDVQVGRTAVHVDTSPHAGRGTVNHGERGIAIRR
ncbi:hypothetical protein D3C80_1825910 [compost metagenome]